MLYEDGPDGLPVVTGLRMSRAGQERTVKADAYVAALDVPGAKKLIPQVPPVPCSYETSVCSCGTADLHQIAVDGDPAVATGRNCWPHGSKAQGPMQGCRSQNPDASTRRLQGWRNMESFDNIWKLVGVPVITVQLRYNGWVTEMQVLLLPAPDLGAV